MRVKLRAVGNPDFRPGHPHREIAIPTMWVAVESLEEASGVCRRYILDNDLGAGNWAGGQVHDSQSGEKIAQIGYNGRIWPVETDAQLSEPPIAVLPVPAEITAWCKEEGYEGYEDWMLLAERIGSSWLPYNGIEDLMDEICYRHETLTSLLVGDSIDVGEPVPFTGPETVRLPIPACTCGNLYEIATDVHKEDCLYSRIMMQICVYDVERGKHTTKG